MIEWPDDLIKVLANRRNVIFLGSGISINSTNDKGERPPSWGGFLDEALSILKDYNKEYYEVAKACEDRKDMLMECEIIREGLGQKRYEDILKRKFLNPRYNAAQIHKDIFDLDSRIVITPNFDKIYEVYANTESQGTVITKTYKDTDIIDCIRKDEPLIIKMHGTIDSPNSMIFTRRDYSKAWNENRMFYKIIESLLLSHTFLFLGAGLNDPDVRLLLESIAISYTPSRTHYFVLPKDSVSEIELHILSDLLNLEFITYDANDNHKELLESVSDLNEQVDKYRVENNIV